MWTRCFDVQGNTIHIHKALVKNIDKKLEKKTTKTVTSSRFVTMPEFVIELFPNKGPIVSITPDAITHRFSRILSRLNIKHFRFHDLRHYSASIMHAIGIPDQYIMSRGGWCSDKVLKSIYRGTMDDYQKHFTDIANNHFNNLCNTECNTKK